MTSAEAETMRDAGEVVGSSCVTSEAMADPSVARARRAISVPMDQVPIFSTLNEQKMRLHR